MKESNGTGYRRVLFNGYSMYPSLKPGDVLVLAAVKAQAVECGDIICVARGGRYITHRVIDIHASPTAQNLITKGDNLPYPDPPLSAGSGPLLKVTMVMRKNGRLIRPRFGKALACLSRKNFSVGIIRGRVGGIMRGVFGRFHALLSREPGRQ